LAIHRRLQRRCNILRLPLGIRKKEAHGPAEAQVPLRRPSPRPVPLGQARLGSFACRCFRRAAVRVHPSPHPCRPAAFADWPPALWPTHGQPRHLLFARPVASPTVKFSALRAGARANLTLRFRAPESMTEPPYLSACARQPPCARKRPSAIFSAEARVPLVLFTKQTLPARVSPAQASSPAASTGKRRYQWSPIAIDDKHPFRCFAHHPNRRQCLSTRRMWRPVIDQRRAAQ
jgi:hypothetical protein